MSDPLTIIHADCIAHMATMAEASVDAIVTDPPYDLTGNARPSTTELMRGVGRGFMGKTWDGTGVAFKVETWALALRVLKPGGCLIAFGGPRTYHRMTCAIEDAGFEIRDCLMWLFGQGFPKSKALLKPAYEPIVLARKPGPLVELNIDASRLSAEGNKTFTERGRDGRREHYRTGTARGGVPSDIGRWPANVLLDEEAAAMLDQQSGERRTGGAVRPTRQPIGFHGGAERLAVPIDHKDVGGASRYFFVSKARKGDRGAGNTHPTVKPLDLMRHLVRLVTPPGGLVLDPFAGSGTTGQAAVAEGFRCVLIERELEYVDGIRKWRGAMQLGTGIA